MGAGGVDRPWSAVAGGSTSFDWLTGSHFALHWIASVPGVGGSVAQTWDPGSGGVDHRVRAGVGSRLHAYGGLAYAVGPGSSRWLVSAADGQVWDGIGRQLTRTSHVYGDLHWSGGDLLGVREDDNGDDIVVVEAPGRDPRVLLHTDGFLATPRMGNGRLAWVQWDRDVMPWDSSEVWVADYEPGGPLGRPRRITGGPAESALQPLWGQDGDLYLLSDRTGWWNLLRWRGGQIAVVAPVDAGCATAPWESSYTNYVLLPGGRVAMAVHNGPCDRLVVVDSAGTSTRVGLPYTSIKPFLAAVGDRVGLIGSSPTRGQEIALVATDGSDRVDVIQPGAEPPGPSQLSVPEVLTVDSAGTTVTVRYYPPAGRTGPAPLIVRAHAGPTYHRRVPLGRAGAVLHQPRLRRGRRRLPGQHWVRARVSQGAGRQLGPLRRAGLPQRRGVPAGHRPGAGRGGVSGASAGGYTALRAVCEDGPFVLAVARSAIVDPTRRTTTAPRFQRPHATVLSHDGARVDPQRLRRPVLVIHGADDRVAPISDAEGLASAAAERGLLVRMLGFDGEGHDLSTPALIAALEAELDAYQAILSAGVPAS